MLRHWFLEHPRSVGETYFEHQRKAFGFSVKLIGAACACFVHGLIPKLFERTGSETIAVLHRSMVIERNRSSSLKSSHEGQPQQVANSGSEG